MASAQTLKVPKSACSPEGTGIAWDLTVPERTPLANTLTRRHFLAAAGAVVGAAAAFGFQSASAQGTPVASPISGEWPRTVHGSLGDARIPAKPTRIVAMSD